MADGSCLIPECYIDTNLIETISFAGCNHQKSCSMVVGTMRRKYADRFAVGIIDKDKREVSALKEFDWVTDNGSLFLLKHRERPHYIVQISPAVEMFVMGAVTAKGTRFGDYGLPDDFDALKRMTKTVTSKKDADFRRLFKDLSDTPQMLLLRDVLLYLVEKRYDADVNVLREMFATDKKVLSLQRENK